MVFKEHYESFLRKSVKQSEIINYQPRTFDTVDTKSVITKHPNFTQIIYDYKVSLKGKF